MILVLSEVHDPGLVIMVISGAMPSCDRQTFVKVITSMLAILKDPQIMYWSNLDSFKKLGCRLYDIWYSKVNL